MSKTPFPELWKLKITPTGPKIIPRPDRECPKCYEVGEIIRDEPYSKRLGITRKCQNKECECPGKEWTYDKPWTDYCSRAEQEDYEKFLKEKGGSRPDFSREKIDEFWKQKKSP
jgi:hypothetical protein